MSNILLDDASRDSIAAGTLGGAARPRGPRSAPGATVPRSAPPRRPTVGQRWRLRRNLTIYLAHTKGGLSQRLLADVFDLPRSRIGRIIAGCRDLDKDTATREDIAR